MRSNDCQFLQTPEKFANATKSIRKLKLSDYKAIKKNSIEIGTIS